MRMNRREFIGGLGAAGAVTMLPGGTCLAAAAAKPKVAVQMYSIYAYVGKQDVGLAKAFKDVAALGYKGVEFYHYYGYKDPKKLKAMLDDAGIVACGTHLAREDLSPAKIAATCEFNLGFGNNVLICPGGGNFPEKGENLDDFVKMIADFYNKAAEDAAKFGCKVGIHNHMREFQLKLKDGTTYWDYFFSHTDPRVCMEQDVGWTTAAGQDPVVQYAKYPHRSPTLHAKENGAPDAILGQKPKPGAKSVDWDGLVPATVKDGVQWYVVECERHQEDLSAVGPSRTFLAGKGL